ncbi:MAG: hypothetical protein IRY95_04820, partial [Clostridia bacterium]|nr:hypothetical protein [Clostridia bacterium]
MPGVGVSRWTMAYFGAALVGFVAAQAAVAFGWAYPAAGLTAPATLATVHVVTVGWLTVLILGALHQFVPVITARPLTSEAVAGWALVAVEAGLAAMVAGFLGLSGGLPGALSGASRGVAPTSLWLPVGGSLVVAGVTSAAVNLARNFWRARPLPLAARFVAAGLGFLVATVLLGLVLALALAWPGGLAPDHLAVVLARGLPLHLLAGIGGWFTLTAMGVAYKLLAMFTLAPEDRGAAGRWAFDLTAGGLALAWLGGVAQASSALAGWAGAVAGGAVAATGWAAALVGAALYLGDMARLF